MWRPLPEAEEGFAGEEDLLLVEGNNVDVEPAEQSIECCRAVGCPEPHKDKRGLKEGWQRTGGGRGCWQSLRSRSIRQVLRAGWLSEPTSRSPLFGETVRTIAEDLVFGEVLVDRLKAIASEDVLPLFEAECPGPSLAGRSLLRRSAAALPMASVIDSPVSAASSRTVCSTVELLIWSAMYIVYIKGG